MPCYDSRNSDVIFDHLQEENKKLIAMLCALSSVIDANKIADELKSDWNADEIGLPYSEYANWWYKHKEQDRIRREAEAEKILLNGKIAYALSKLTDEEIKLLNIK